MQYQKQQSAPLMDNQSTIAFPSRANYNQDNDLRSAPSTNTFTYEPRAYNPNSYS